MCLDMLKNLFFPIFQAFGEKYILQQRSSPNLIVTYVKGLARIWIVVGWCAMVPSGHRDLQAKQCDFFCGLFKVRELCNKADH